MALEGNNSHQEGALSEFKIFYERPKRVRSKKSYREFGSDDENSEVDIIVEDIKRRRVKERFDEACPNYKVKRKESPSHVALEKKQKQMTETLRWLGENYELKEGMCLPRCVMYTHYLDFCKKNKLCPAGPATFGKIIRQKFPKLTTRRLGTRGQSKCLERNHLKSMLGKIMVRHAGPRYGYHYYGIQVNESSPYFHAGYSKQGLTRFSTMKTKGEGSNKKFALGSKARTLLPDFPDAKKLNIPKGVSLQKVETFIMMYRTHCQRLLDTVISANFDGVQNFLLHFWQGMPSHLISVLQCPVVVDVIAICDSILYKVLIDVLIPSSIQDIPDSLREEIREFASKLIEWLRESLSQVPSMVREAKLKVAQTFGNALTRQVCFVHLAQTARSVLLSYDSVSRMIADLRKIDFDDILTKTMFVSQRKDIPSKTKMFVQEFEGLLSKQAPLEAYTEWLDSVVDRCILKECEVENGETFEEKAAEFLGTWALFTSNILEDLTLRSAPSFGVFHLIQTTFQEYVLLIMENQKMLGLDRNLHKSMRDHMKDGFQEGELNREPMQYRRDDGSELVLKDEIKPHAIPLEPLISGSKSKRDTNNNKAKNLTHDIDSNNALNLLSKLEPPIKYTPRNACIGLPVSPVSTPRQVTSVPPNMETISSQRQIFPQFQVPTSVANIPVSERQIRGIPQYAFSDEMSGNTPEMTAFHGDFINAIDKSLFTCNSTMSAPEFMANPWMQNDGQSLTVLNTVNYSDPTGATGVNVEMNYRRTADFGLGYSSEPNIATNGIHPLEIPTSMNARSDFSYNHQGKEDYATFPNGFSRYNNLYFDSMRNSGQGMNADVMNFAAGMMQQPSSTMEMENMIHHDTQMNRLGVGAV